MCNLNSWNYSGFSKVFGIHFSSPLQLARSISFSICLSLCLSRCTEFVTGIKGFFCFWILFSFPSFDILTYNAFIKYLHFLYEIFSTSPLPLLSCKDKYLNKQILFMSKTIQKVVDTYATAAAVACWKILIKLGTPKRKTETNR